MPKETNKPVNVLIAEGTRMFAEALGDMLQEDPEIIVVGVVSNGKEAVERVGELSPDIVIMDIMMPEMNGLEATKEIYEKYPQTRVVMLSQYDDEENILAAERLGAYGFIPKRAASSQLVNAIRAVHYVGERLARPTPSSG